MLGVAWSVSFVEYLGQGLKNKACENREVSEHFVYIDTIIANDIEA